MARLSVETKRFVRDEVGKMKVELTGELMAALGGGGSDLSAKLDEQAQQLTALSEQLTAVGQAIAAVGQQVAGVAENALKAHGYSEAASNAVVDLMGRFEALRQVVADLSDKISSPPPSIPEGFVEVGTMPLTEAQRAAIEQLRSDALVMVDRPTT